MAGKRPESGADETILPHQAWARMVMVLAAVVVVYFGGHNLAGPGGSGRTVMARGSEALDDKRYQNLLCAPSYRKEIKDLGNDACLPAKCGRMVMDGIISDDEAHAVLNLAKRGFSATEGSAGGASILDLHSGALSKGQQFVNVYKTHPDLFQKKDFELYRFAYLISNSILSIRYSM
jgi:hypothetical protein